MKSFNLSSLAAVAGLLGLSYAQGNSTFSPARPPAIPLAVRSPYLSTWQQSGSDGGNGGYLAGEWPIFWPGQITGWAGLIRVDNAVYTWLGAPRTESDSHPIHVPPVVNQTSFRYTSTRSIFTFDVGGYINMTVEYLSNVAPTDYKRQSFPFSYMNVEVASMDGKPHAVQLYTDISAEWISGDRFAIAEWSYGVIDSGTATAKKPRNAAAEPTPIPLPSTTEITDDAQLEARQAREDGHFRTYGTQTSYTGYRSAVRHTAPALPKTSNFIQPQATAIPTKQHNVVPAVPGPNNDTQPSGIAYHKIYRQTQLLFSETAQQADWGNWYYVTRNVKNLTHAIGTDATVRSAFETEGYLNNTIDNRFRAINDSYPVFGYSIDLGQVDTASQSVLWGIALAQEEGIQFEGYNGNQTLPSLWTSYFSDELDALSFYYDDYATASTAATSLDNQIASDSAAAVNSNYTTMTSLATRQVFGAMYLANTTETPLVFLKEISSDGNINTVDMIFPTHPILIYLNPTLLKQMLDPLFINQEAGNWPQAYSIHDIGAAYPNATGHNDGQAEMQPLEECGDMIIMTLAYAQRTNDTAYLSQHYAILRQWNEYLIEEALIPDNQISTDDFAGALANQTNLAIKGIIGIEAMAQIANRTGNIVDGQNYTQIAHNYSTQWQSLGFNLAANPPHSTLNYGNDSSHGILYNIFADKELGLQLLPQNIYDIQSNFYPTVFGRYGVPLDTRHTYTKSDESMMAASVASADTRAQFVDVISTWINETPTNLGCSDLYDTITGDFAIDPNTTKRVQFEARPAVGGFFSVLALQSAPSDGFVEPAGNGTSTA